MSPSLAEPLQHDGEPGASGATVAQAHRAAVRAWDFRNPDKLSKDHLRSLLAMHQSFAREASTALSGRLRTVVGIKVISVEQGMYEDYVALLPARCVLTSVSLAPLPGAVLLDLAPELALTMIDLLLGGDGRDVDADRDLTDIDAALVRTLARTPLDALRESWSALAPITPEVIDVTANPQLMHAVTPGDSVLIVLMEVSVGPCTGTMSLCVPHRVLEPVVQRLSPQLLRAGRRETPTQETRDRIEVAVRAAPVRVAAVAGETEIELSQISQIRPGDVLLFGAGRELRVALRVADTYLFRGKPGLVGRRLAVKIDKMEGVPRGE